MRLQTYSRLTFMALLLMVFVQVASAQTVKELEQQRKQTLQSLETTSKMLNQTQKSQRSSLNKLSIINKNIKDRKTLIGSITTEIVQLDSEMDRLEQEKRLLQNRLKSLKTDYARLVQEAHINRSLYTKIMFILSAETFDQSYRRLRYLQEYTDYRKEQVRQIEKVTVQIEQKNDSLKKHKTTKVEIVKQKETEAQKLARDEKKEKTVLTDLKKKESKLRADLKVQQRKANDLNNKIARIIAEEIRKAEAKRAEEERKRLAAESKSTKTQTKTPSKTSTKSAAPAVTKSVSALTKEETLLAGDFARNIGRLPWPVSNGFISGRYGVQAHPVLKHVTTNNKGIYIKTPVGSTARAVFDGVVTQRFSIPGSNNAVIIKHGNYRTVYANLTQIYVNEGDKVSAKQSIGKIYTDDDGDNKTELYFQIWKDKNLLNPESWIAK